MLGSNKATIAGQLMACALTVAAFRPLRQTRRERRERMNAVSCVKNECVKNMHLKEKTLAAGATLKNSYGGNKEMKNDGIMWTKTTETDGGRRTNK